MIGNLQPKFDAFISYASEQDAIVKELSAALQRGNIRCYAYKQIVEPGLYHLRQAEVIKDAAFVLVVSRDAADESRGFDEIIQEIETAKKYKKQIIPVFVSEEVRHDPDVVNRLGIAGLDGETLRGSRLDSPTAERLAQKIRRSLGRNNAITNDVFGRDNVVAQLRNDIASDHRRFYFIYGPPGAGKSTVATQVHMACAADGWTVRVANLSQDDTKLAHVVTRVKSCMHIEADAGASVEELRVLVRQRVVASQPFLLYLDNFEQVTPEEEERFLDWCRGIDGLKVLVTSRVLRSSHVPGVVGRSLDPLRVPTDEEATSLVPAALEESFPVMRLFLDRVKDFHASEPLLEVQAALQREPAVIRKIAQLCSVLGGFPAPIDQAARNFARFGRIERYIRDARRYRQVLRPGDGSSETMEIAVRSTVASLPDQARRAFLLLSQFIGGCDDDAADAVLEGLGDTYALRVRLNECGLLRAEPPNRWLMYLPIQEAAEAIVSELGDAAIFRSNFAELHQQLFVERAKAIRKLLEGPGTGNAQAHALASALADRHNLRVAVMRACEQGHASDAYEVLLALIPLYVKHGPASVLLELAEAVAASGDDQGVSARAHIEAAKAAELLGRYRVAHSHMQRAEACAPSDDARLRLIILSGLRNAGEHTGEQDTLSRVHKELVELVPRLEAELKPNDLCKAYIEAAYSSEHADGFDRAHQFAVKAVQLARKGGLDDFLAWRAITCVGLLLWRDAQLDASLAIHQEALAHAEQHVKIIKAKGGSLTNIGLVKLDMNRFDEAFEAIEQGYPLTFDDKDYEAVNRTARVMATLYKNGTAEGAARRAAAEEALKLAAQYEEMVLGTEYGQTIALFLQIKGEAQYWCKEPEQAETTLQSARRWSRSRSNSRALERDFAICVLLARLAVDAGRRDDARVFIDDATEFVRIRRLADREWPIERTRSMYFAFQRIQRMLGGKQV